MSNLLASLTHGNSLVTTASYDLDERLTSLQVTHGAALVQGYGCTATYIYNALEQMISRQTNAAGAPTTIVHYIYDLDGHLIAEANGSAAGTTITSLREYIWLPANDNNNDTMAEELVAANDNNVPDLPLAVIDVAATPTISQVHTDHLGRPVRMTSATKATTWSTVWTPWGAAHATTGTATNNLRFPGQYFLIETGLAYNWHRTYDPATGRYTQPDPLRFVDGPSVYAYAGNSPFMVTDPSGQCIWDGCIVEGIVVGALFGLAVEYFTNGDCATAGDYALAAGLGAIPGGAAVKGIKAFRYFNGVRRARTAYPRLVGKFNNHHNWPKYLGGPANGALTRLEASYHQVITNAFRRAAAYGRPKVSADKAAEIMKEVYSKNPLSWW